VRKSILIGLVILASAATATAVVSRPDKGLRVVTAFVSHTLCSETFVAGLDPDQTYRETFKGWPVVRRLLPAIRYEVDRGQREVRATLAGVFASRAVYRDGLGCVQARAGNPAPARMAALEKTDEKPVAEGPHIAPPQVVEPANSRLRSAVDRAFVEPEGGPQRATKAVIIFHEDRIVAERYAPGYGIDTPLYGYSVTKSVVNALIGILVRQGRLSIDTPAPVAAWRDPADPRHAITVEQLMRMTSGLALDEKNNGFDAASRMLYLESDMAGFAESAGLIAAPGSRWYYSSPSTLILSRIVRDAVGGHPEDVLRFARGELFDPLGMQNVTLEFDAAGTPIGSTHMWASARDWTRFGALYLNDGMVGGRRILPEGWVRFSASPTPGATLGYGAGFFTNLGDSDFAKRRVLGGMPAGSFFASGTLGQRIVIAPAERLVVVRFGRSLDFPTFDIQGLMRLVADANAAVHNPQRGSRS
jgi:CubicO group peptidase (beta-lactamase class C family)